jgi:LuxR family maltose regulon positive regulatory protein
MNELVLAKEHAAKAIKKSKLLADERLENLTHSIAPRIFLACGDMEMAVNSLRVSEKFVPNPGIVYDMRGGDYPHIRLWLVQNNLLEIKSWLKNEAIELDASSDFRTIMTYTMHARAMITLAREYTNGDTYLPQAQDLLSTLFSTARNNGWGAKMIEIQMLQALAYDLADDKESAMTALESAIHPAEPGGFVRIFVDEGPPMARLLYEALSRGIAPDYVQKLLAAFPVDEPEKDTVNQPKVSDSDWIEPLSDRELEVLHLIAAGLSRHEIAVQLVLSLNTIKTHARNIYGKLGVHSQLQAVRKAQGLGLLEQK